MKLPILTDGCVLPVSDQIIQVLSNELFTAHPSVNPMLDLTAITFNFRDPNYSAEQGGYHPVEIRISRCSSGFQLDYITDFSYVGSGWASELAKEIDFDFQSKICEMRYCRPVPISGADDLFRMFQDNFLAYYKMDIFTVELTLEAEN